MLPKLFFRRRLVLAVSSSVLQTPSIGILTNVFFFFFLLFLIFTFGFEFADAVLATGTMAFTAVQRMMGAVEFMPYLESTTASNAVGDPAGCLAGSHSEAPLKEMVLREMR